MEITAPTRATQFNNDIFFKATFTHDTTLNIRFSLIFFYNDQYQLKCTRINTLVNFAQFSHNFDHQLDDYKYSVLTKHLFVWNKTLYTVDTSS